MESFLPPLVFGQPARVVLLLSQDGERTDYHLGAAVQERLSGDAPRDRLSLGGAAARVALGEEETCGPKD